MAAPTPGLGLKIRPAVPGDAAAVWRIYNQGIEDRLATFTTQIRPLGEVEAWLKDPRFTVLLAENFRQPAGWALLRPYRDGATYRTIAEMNIYVDRSWRRHAVGRLLAKALFEEARAKGFSKLLGYLLERNLSGRKLVERLGFREVGVHYRHGDPREAAPDVVVVEKLL